MTACFEGHVWQCRKVSNIDWCNQHAPTSSRGWAAWKLLPGQPQEVEEEEDVEETGDETRIEDEYTAYDNMTALFNNTNLTKGYEELHKEIYVLKVPIR